MAAVLPHVSTVIHFSSESLYVLLYLVKCLRMASNFFLSSWVPCHPISYALSMQRKRKQKFSGMYTNCHDYYCHDYFCRSATHEDYIINPDYLGNLCASVSHLLTFSEIFEEAHVYRQSGARCI
jgi:hypothetical protein